MIDIPESESSQTRPLMASQNTGKGSPPLVRQAPTPPNYVYTGATYVPQPPAHLPPGSQVQDRFWKAFAIAGIIWLSLIGLTHELRWHYHSHRPWFTGSPPMPLPGDGKSFKCLVHAATPNQNTLDDLRDYPFTSKYSVDFDISADDTVYFLAHGSRGNGAIEVTGAPDIDNVKVDITAYYYTEYAIEEANICHLQRNKNDHGIGIYTGWNRPNRDNQIRFEIVVRLPLSKSRGARKIKGLETNLPLFKHLLGNLRGEVDFQVVDLQTSNMPISAKSLYASNELSLKTSNGPIEGSFASSNSLDLVTSNSPIRADVSLFDEEDKKGRSVNLRARTSNSPLTLDVSLLRGSPETAKQDKGGNYSVSASTSNSRLLVKFDDAPLDSLLNTVAKTSNSPASVTVHPSYEGSFSAKSSLYTPTVRQTNAEDPSGKGRERTIHVYKVGRGLLMGAAQWGPFDEKKERGSVDVSTSNSRAEIVI